MKRTLFTLLNILVFIFVSYGSVSATTTNISIDPNLDISYFDNYTVSADISPAPSSASVNLRGLIDGVPAEWDYCADGTGTAQDLTYDMTFDSGTTWKKTYIRPDHIYPTILFAPAGTTWGTTPVNSNIRRQNYHLLHFSNPFTMATDMNFWIEVNAEPVSSVNSADLLVYLVEKGHESSFFQSDWRNNTTDLELVGVIDRKEAFHHEHSENSEHYLIRLTANADKTFGSRNLDISGDFWVILYNTSPNINRGWNLKYQTSSSCSTSGRWLTGNITGWTVTSQSGYPDAHVHFARRSTPIDGTRVTVTADSTSESQDFSFAVLPNLAPNATNFTNPVRGVYSGTVNVSWNEATDPNGDAITYNLYLLDPDGNVSQTLSLGTSSTSFSWNTADGETDGDYSLKGQACDASLCTDFYSQTFSLNNTADIYSLSSITMSSNNESGTTATTGDTVTLSFTASGTLSTPTVYFYSGGYSVNNSAAVINTSGNNWTATYIVDSSDTNGQVTFAIAGTNLDLEYTEITSGDYVTVSIVSSSPTNSPSSPSAPSCNDQKPNGVPDLFQIDISNTSAVLYYAPIRGNVDNYYISYSEKSDSYQHGVFTKQGESSGVLSFTINLLKPNTTYYFKVRGQNGCMPGEFGSELAARTKISGIRSVGYFYKYYQNSVISKIRGIIREGSSFKGVVMPNPTITVKPDENKTENISNDSPNPPKKRCFLWWCF